MSFELKCRLDPKDSDYSEESLHSQKKEEYPRVYIINKHVWPTL